MDKDMQGVYRIRNKLNNKRYIGSTNDFERGWRARRWALRRGDYYNTHLQRAWNKYGEENFVFEIEEEVAGDSKALLACEQIYLDNWLLTGLLYNIAREAHRPSFKGHHHTEEAKEKMSEVRRGLVVPQAARDKMSIAKKEWHKTHDNPRKGKRLTEETKQLLRERALEWHKTHENSFKGRYHTDDAKWKNSESNRRYWATHRHPMEGKHHTQESRDKISASQTSRFKTYDNPFRGKHHTQESKSKMSESHKEWHRTHEHPRGRAGSYPAFFNSKISEYISAGRNLKKLCEEKGLNYGIMLKIKIKSTIQSRDGWRLAGE